jgi:hypothetical protein
MSERADKRLPVRGETKQLIDERKPEGMTYDLWLRREALGVE